MKVKDNLEAQDEEIKEDMVAAFKSFLEYTNQLDERVEEVNQVNLDLKNKIEELQSKVDTADEECCNIE